MGSDSATWRQTGVYLVVEFARHEYVVTDECESVTLKRRKR